MKNQKPNFLHRLMTIVMIVSLWLPTPLIANQQQNRSKLGANQAFNMAVQYGMKMYQQFAAQRMAALNQQLMARKMAQARKQMQSMGPQMQPDRFYGGINPKTGRPTCLMPYSMSKRPDVEQICPTSSSTLQKAHPANWGYMESQGRGFQSLAKKYLDTYLRVGNTNQNTNNPEGIQCLEKNLNKTLNKFDTAMNNLTDLITNLKANLQMVRDRTKKMQDEIDDLNAQIKGGNIFGQRGSNKEVDFSNLLANNPGCKNLLSGKAESLVKGPKASLAGMEAFLKNGLPSANNHEGKASKYRDQIVKQKRLLTQVIQKENLFDPSKLMDRLREDGMTEFGGVALALRVSLNKAKRSLPTNIAEGRKNSTTSGQQALMNKCATKNYDVAMPLKDILNNIKDQHTTANANAVKNEVANIFKKNIPLEQKIAAFKKFHQENPTIRFHWKDHNRSKRHRQKRYMRLDYYLQRVQVECRKIVVPKVASAKNTVKNFAKAKQAFIKDLLKRIDKNVVTCKGHGKIMPGDCSKPGVFQTESPKYCGRIANQCSKNIKSCFAQVASTKKLKEAELKAKVARYNAYITQMQADQQSYLKGFEKATKDSLALIQEMFPGERLTPKWPAGIMVPMPPNQRMGGMNIKGGLDYLQMLERTLPLQMAKFQDVYVQQQQKLKAAIDQHIDKQKRALQANVAYWTKIQSQCKASSEALATAQDQMKKAQQQSVAKKQQAVRATCNNYRAMMGQRHPHGACAQLKKVLASGGQVLSTINPLARKNIGEVSQICALYNNKNVTKKSKDSDKNNKKYNLVNLCANSDWKSIYNSLGQKLLTEAATLSPAGEDWQKAAHEFLTKKRKALPAGLANSKIGHAMRNLRKIDEKKQKKVDYKLRTLLSENVDAGNNARSYDIDIKAKERSVTKKKERLKENLNLICNTLKRNQNKAKKIFDNATFSALKGEDCSTGISNLSSTALNNLSGQLKNLKLNRIEVNASQAASLKTTISDLKSEIERLRDTQKNVAKNGSNKAKNKAKIDRAIANIGMKKNPKDVCDTINNQVKFNAVRMCGRDTTFKCFQEQEKKVRKSFKMKGLAEYDAIVQQALANNRTSVLAHRMTQLGQKATPYCENTNAVPRHLQLASRLGQQDQKQIGKKFYKLLQRGR